MWFDSWSDLIRVLLVGLASYAALVVVLRIAGKRTLGSFNAFDFVVTVALGSTLATILLSADVSFLEGALALVLLIALQAVVAAVSQRSARLHRFLSTGPTVLVRDGVVQDDALRRTRVAREDLEQAIRSSGVGAFGLVACAVLESNGQISVIPRDQLGDGSALPDVERRHTG